MLLINQQLDKLAASHVDFQMCGMLDVPLSNQDVQAPLPEGEEHHNDDDNGGVIDTHDILGKVTLARVPSTCYP